MSQRAVERTLHWWRTTGEVISPSQQEPKKNRTVMTEHEIEVLYFI
jgi:hypothetical protein